jgi:predicted nucleotidyltransferase
VTTLLQQIETDRRSRREALRLETREALRAALRDLIPHASVLLFGSTTRPNRFNEYSDVDIALETEPAGLSIYQLISLLGERLGRRVDVVLLPECRFRDRLRAEGELWTPPH